MTSAKLVYWDCKWTQAKCFVEHLARSRNGRTAGASIELLFCVGKTLCLAKTLHVWRINDLVARLCSTLFVMIP